jgi:hypothetical protein
MDSDLIAPSPDGVWRSSKRLRPRRSRGEAGLAALDGEELLPPRDEAFRPDKDGLIYRTARLQAAGG